MLGWALLLLGSTLKLLRFTLSLLSGTRLLLSFTLRDVTFVLLLMCELRTKPFMQDFDSNPAFQKSGLEIHFSDSHVDRII